MGFCAMGPKSGKEHQAVMLVGELMMNFSISTALQDSIFTGTLELRRIQTHNFSTAFIMTLLKTGQKSQLKNTQFTSLFGRSSLAESDRPLSD